MNNITLTPRLELIAKKIAKNAVLADIGTDHAHLPIYLLENGIIKSAIASDIRVGPLQKAEENTKKHGFEDKISLRLGAGLEKVKPNECDTISIAGMGGETIAQILSDARWTNSKDYTLLLQPMTMIYYLRKWLWQNGYEILEENVCKEEHRRYVVMTVKGGYSKKDVPFYKCCVSNALLKADGAKDYLQAQIKKETSALNGLKMAKSIDSDRLNEQQLIVDTLKQSLEEIIW